MSFTESSSNVPCYHPGQLIQSATACKSFKDSKCIGKNKSLSEISFSVFFSVLSSHIMRYGSDSKSDIDSVRGHLDDVLWNETLPAYIDFA
jgi:hypothetical protein